VLDAYVEIMVVLKDVVAARTAAEELSGIAQRFDAPQLHAMSGRANGAVQLAEGNAKGALAALRQSWEIWTELDAPYEAARTRVLMACACRASSDCDTAKLEMELACEVFNTLGAAADLANAKVFRKQSEPDLPLTDREIEVLRLVASGKTNRAIA